MYQLNQFHSYIFSWWRTNGRILPWREKKREAASKSIASFVANETGKVRESIFDKYFSKFGRDPYRVVVSEIMLQQTQVDRVLLKYTQWMEKWPSIKSLSNAKLSEVIVEWKGLGYNRRARFLWLLAKEISEHRNGVWPTTEKELLQLPGIGRYTARAILSFCFQKSVGVVDTNVKRIFERWFYIQFHDHASKTDFFRIADEVLPQGMADPWNQALMDFGALVCTAKKPKCEQCPVVKLCQANLTSQHEGFHNYAQKLSEQFKTSDRIIKKTRGKDIKDGKKIKFEETDRYLRGRLVDLMREKSWNRKEIVDFLSNKYGQFDLTRIDQNIDQLLKEKLIYKRKSILSLD